jgi:glycosyltransferase involved in cell wall biosynthesis
MASLGPVSVPTPIPSGSLQAAASADLVPLAVVVLTRDEEANLPYALATVAGWASEIWVVDAGSTDRTVEIAESRGAKVMRHAFAGYAAQRTWALRSLPFGVDWVLFLDADEAVTPELREELRAVLAAPPAGISGFYVKRRFVFLGRWIRHGGYYPVWLLRVVRHAVARCEERGVDEHLLVDGDTARLRYDLLHEDRRPLSRWIQRHLQYAALAASDLERAPSSGGVAARLRSDQPAERSRWWYDRVYRRIPLGARAMVYFAYRYIVRGGFLDGREGFIYYVLQVLWYRTLIDANILEARRIRGGAPAGSSAVQETARR